MSEFKCQYCKSSFSNKSNLTYHIRTNKKCMLIRNNENSSSESKEDGKISFSVVKCLFNSFKDEITNELKIFIKDIKDEIKSLKKENKQLKIQDEKQDNVIRLNKIINRFMKDDLIIFSSTNITIFAYLDSSGKIRELDDEHIKKCESYKLKYDKNLYKDYLISLKEEEEEEKEEKEEESPEICDFEKSDIISMKNLYHTINDLSYIDKGTNTTKQHKNKLELIKNNFRGMFLRYFTETKENNDKLLSYLEGK